jgi:hypothetical protein
VTHSGQVAVEMVIQTATSLAANRLAPREAVTILAGQVPRATGQAPSLAIADPQRASTYAALLGSLVVTLRGELARSPDRDLGAVADDLELLARALER